MEHGNGIERFGEGQQPVVPPIVGSVSELYRYPVKSFGGERLEQVLFGPGGPIGDRAYAVIDETKQGFARYVTARQVPQLLHYRAKLADGLKLEITAPSGEPRYWDSVLLEELRGLSGRASLALQESSLDAEQLAFADEAPVHLVTDASLRRLGQQWGRTLDLQRFRPNVVIAADASVQPFAEAAWIGRRLRLGEAELLVTSACVRCRMIATDPQSLKADSSLLRLVSDEHEACFGIYAKIMRPGVTAPGDHVILLNCKDE